MMENRSDIIKLDGGVWVSKKSITDGPVLNRKHVDGPLLTWGGYMHWLTIWERFLLVINFSTLDEIAARRFPELYFKRIMLWNE